jgi:hypothetical protein
MNDELPSYKLPTGDWATSYTLGSEETAGETEASCLETSVEEVGGCVGAGVDVGDCAGCLSNRTSTLASRASRAATYSSLWLLLA